MKLFDEKERLDPSKINSDETRYMYYDRSSSLTITAIREYLNDWFAYYPEAEQSELRARFESEDGFESSFHELFIYRICTELGISLDIHPKLEGTTKRPDHLASVNGYQFFSEAIHITGSSAKQKAQENIRKRVIETIDEIGLKDLWIFVKHFELPERSIPLKRIKNFIRQEVAQLDLEQLKSAFATQGLKAMPQWLFEDGDFKLLLTPFPGNPEGSGNIGMQMGKFEEIEDYKYIKKAINKKTSRYGELDKPFLLWIDCGEEFITEESVFQALFGNMVVDFSGEGPLKEQYSGEGAFIHNNRPQNTRLSGIVFTSGFQTYQLNTAKIAFINNPFTANPIDHNILPFDKIILSQNASSGLGISRVSGAKITEILTIPKEALSD